MSDIKQQIFAELTELEGTVQGLCGAVENAGKQTNLEVAILTEQVKNLRKKNEDASEMIGRSVSILKNMKK